MAIPPPKLKSLPQRRTSSPPSSRTISSRQLGTRRSGGSPFLAEHVYVGITRPAEPSRRARPPSLAQCGSGVPPLSLQRPTRRQLLAGRQCHECAGAELVCPPEWAGA